MKGPVLRLIVVWCIFFLALISTFLWLNIENAKSIALYQQSTLCGSPIEVQQQANCHENTTGTLDQVSFIYSGQRASKFGGAPSISEVTAVDLYLRMPDGSIATARVSSDENYQSKVCEGVDPNFSFYLGDRLTVRRWYGKIVTLKTEHSPVILTLDYPENVAKDRDARARSIFGILFFALLFYSGYESLRVRRYGLTLCSKPR